MPHVADRPVRLQPYFGYRNERRLILTARALRSAKPAFEKRGRLQAMRTMLAQFASREVAGLPVRLELKSPAGDTAQYRATTDREGFVRFEVALDPDWPRPAETAWEVACLHWIDPLGAHCVEAHVLAPGREATVGIVSDIDDTIIETGVTGGVREVARNWRRVLAELPDERIAVPGADVFFGALGGGAVLPGKGGAGASVPATRRPFFYVSSSPWNLFSYLVAFLEARKLPLGPLLLRDWGFDRATFSAAGHEEHKRGALDAIMAMYPETRFALIGDDTQGDLVAYADAVANSPGQVVAVFIRTAAREKLSPIELAAKATIEAARVPLWLGDCYDAGRKFLQQAGIPLHGDTAQIVGAIDRTPPSA